MKIEAVDLFYLAMPVVTDAGDGSQDALVVRVRGGGITAWGECEASPLTSIAAFVCPMSHGACKPVARFGSGRRGFKARRHRSNCRHHRVGKHGPPASRPYLVRHRDGVVGSAWPVARGACLSLAWLQAGLSQAALCLATLRRQPGRDAAALPIGARGRFNAVKCGWGPFGRRSVKADADQLAAAREGIGAEGTLLIDAGQIWGEDVAAAEARLPLLKDVKATWLEEPFHGSAYEAYGSLAGKAGSLKLAGGEAAHNIYMARHTIDYGKVGYIQIDCGRIGGIGPAKRVADYAVSKGVTYVNHTFTSHLALCASLQPYAGLASHRICEYPVTPQPMAWEMCANHIEPDENGEVTVPDRPGLGIEVDILALKKYIVDTEIKAGGKTLYRTPKIA